MAVRIEQNKPQVSYNKANIANIDIIPLQRNFCRHVFDTYMRDEFMGKQVVIITDGTDMFDFPFNTKLRRLV
jgi:hypothetical protein